LRVGRRVLRQIGIELILRAEFLAMMPSAQQITALLGRWKTEEAVFVGRDLRLGNAIAVSIQIPRHQFRILERLARGRIEDEALDFSIALANHQREVAHPNVCEGDLILPISEGW